MLQFVLSPNCQLSHSVSVYCGCFLDYHLCEQSYSFRCVEKSICHLVALRQQEQGLSRAVLLVERSLQKTACREERAAPCRKCELQVCGIDLQHGCSTVHIYIYICIYTHDIYIYMYICMYVYICICICVCVCVCVYLYLCLYLYVYVYPYRHIYIYLHMYAYIHTYIYTH